MAYSSIQCKAVNAANTGSTLVFIPYDGQQYTDLWYLRDGYTDATYSTSSASILYSHSCAHHSWGSNNRTYTITMDNVLRNAINAKINSGGLINLQNYTTNITELQGRDSNGNNTMQVFGFLCTSHSITGSFDATQIGYWEGNWPYNFTTDVQYSYNIPGVGTVSDTITAITDGWYTRGNSRRLVFYGDRIKNQYTEAQLMVPPANWHDVPFNSAIYANTLDKTLGYYTINGIYSRNTGSRGCYTDNAADILLNSSSQYFGGMTLNSLVSILGAPNNRYYGMHPTSITNNVILAITNVNFVNNTITVKFAFKHDYAHSMVAFVTGARHSLAAFRISYNFPVTTVKRPVDTWGMTFINKTDFNPNVGNGSGASSLVWSSTNNSVTITAGLNVNNADGFCKIISRSSGTLSCSCVNNNNTVRLTIAGYSITIPSGVKSFDINILAMNGSNLGFWRITPPGVGLSHSFNITYPATENAPLVSFNNEIYTAIIQAINQPGLPFIFETQNITDEYSIMVSGVVRCDVTNNGSKTYYTISIYDVNGDFSRLLVKNGTYVTMPITVTVDVTVVNNTILVKAGMASIGYSSTSVGDVPLSVDAVAVLLPAVASVSKNGARIGYATTTVNQSSFAFSFSALKDEVEQTDDFVSHYLEKQ